jgi:hypothetical protein
MRIDEFLLVFDAYKAAKGMTDTSASTLVFDRGSRIAEVRKGGSITVRVMERSLQFMVDDWPRDARHLWPSGIKRPPRSRAESSSTRPETALAR